MSSKIDDIIKSGRAPGITTEPKDPASVYVKAPKGLAAIENEPIYRHGPARGASRIAEHFGMSTKFIKSVWAKAPLIVLLFACFVSKAGDLTPGQNFHDGDTVSAAQLNGLVGNATVNNSLISGKPSDPAPLGSDALLIYSPTLNGLYRLTLNSGVLQNPALITAQSEKVTPINGDYVLVWDSIGLTLVKVSVANLVLQNTNIVAQQPFIQASNIDQQASTLILNYGTNGQTSFSNLLTVLEYTRALTNLTAHTSPTNNDELLIWDSVNGSNRMTTLAGLFTNTPTATVVSNTDSILIFNTATNGAFGMSASNGVVAHVPLSSLAGSINRLSTLVIGNLPCTNSVMLQSNLVSSVPPAVRAVLVVTNLAGVLVGNYALGDEIPADQLFVLGTGGPAFVYGSSATNVWFAGNLGGASFMLPPKAGGSSAAALIDHTNFSGKLYIAPGL